MTLTQQTPGPLEAFEVVFQDDPISQDEQTPLTLSVARARPVLRARWLSRRPGPHGCRNGCCWNRRRSWRESGLARPGKAHDFGRRGRRHSGDVPLLGGARRGHVAD